MDEGRLRRLDPDTGISCCNTIQAKIASIGGGKLSRCAQQMVAIARGPMARNC
jgi:hypothetical protein